jgi:Fe2+ or Zn2+ uptake regulation protein
MVVTNSRENLLMILVNKTKLLQELIEAGLSKKTKPKDLLAIYKALEKIKEKLVKDMQVSRNDDALAAEFQRGPVLRKGVSRFSASATSDEK